MSNYTHQTAPTQFVEAAGIRFGYRRFANRRFGVKIDIPALLHALYRNQGSLGSRVDRRICPGPRSDGDLVIVHGRFSGFGAPVNWIAADIVRIKGRDSGRALGCHSRRGHEGAVQERKPDVW